MPLLRFCCNERQAGEPPPPPPHGHSQCLTPPSDELILSDIYSSALRIKKQFQTPGSRELVAGEITPVKAEQSGNYTNAGQAIDLNFLTRNRVEADSDGKVWLKLTLDKIYCVKNVIRYSENEDYWQYWTCTKADCSNCVGERCGSFTLTVSTEETVSDFPSISDCRYGDTVKYEKTNREGVRVGEIAIIGEKGKFNLTRNVTEFRRKIQDEITRL